MSIKQYIRRNIYRWHRISSVIIALPVMFWAISGFMHPIMTNIRPNVATQWLMPSVIDSATVKLPLREVLQQNKILSFSNFRLVQIAGNAFYQVKLPQQNVLRYFSIMDGKELPEGDRVYARYLARHFLEQPSPEEKKDGSCCRKGETKEEHRQHMQASMIATSTMPMDREMDCCTNAINAVMKTTTGSKVTNVQMVTAFNEEYKYVNRLLPVYKVSFDREDSIRLYVETQGDRFAFAMDNTRAAFDTFFSFFHTWSWMDGLGNTKYVLMVMLTGLGFFTTLMGLYIFFTTRSKKSNNAVVKNRRLHRVTSLVASLFVLLFTFSGGYHALEKMRADDTGTSEVNASYKTSDVNFDINRLHSAVPSEAITNVSIVTINNQPYFQVFLNSTNKKEAAKKDLMKSMRVPPPRVAYIDAKDYTILKNGEQQYATYLANHLSGYDPAKVRDVELITSFSDEYPFINKRLPVWKVTYEAEGNQRFYVETSSGALASKVKDQDLYEGYSFALLHKHHFMDWGGKGVRDTSTMVAAGLVLLASLVGLFLWIRLLRKI